MDPLRNPIEITVPHKYNYLKSSFLLHAACVCVSNWPAHAIKLKRYAFYASHNRQNIIFQRFETIRKDNCDWNRTSFKIPRATLNYKIVTVGLPFRDTKIYNCKSLETHSYCRVYAFEKEKKTRRNKTAFLVQLHTRLTNSLLFFFSFISMFYYSVGLIVERLCTWDRGGSASGGSVAAPAHAMDIHFQFIYINERILPNHIVAFENINRE